jgi:flagellar protein FliO/FliZ
MLPGLSAILTAIAALAAVIAIILLVARFLRAHPIPRNGAGVLTKRDVLSLDQGRRLHLISCAGRDVLLLTGGPQDLVVGWLPATEAEP